MANIPTIKEVRRVLYNLQRRLARIEQGDGSLLSSFAVDKYKEMVASGQIRNDIRNLTPQERKAMYNDIVELSNLKTSTVKGALIDKQYWADIRPIYNSWTKERQQDFRKMAGRTLELISESFKYEVHEVMAKQIEKGRYSTEKQQERFFMRINKIYEKLAEWRANQEQKTGRKMSDEQFQLRVTNEIDKFLRNLK